MTFTARGHRGSDAVEVDGELPKGREMARTDIRRLEGVELESIPVVHFSGRSR